MRLRPTTHGLRRLGTCGDRSQAPTQFRQPRRRVSRCKSTLGHAATGSAWRPSRSALPATASPATVVPETPRAGDGGFPERDHLPVDFVSHPDPPPPSRRRMSSSRPQPRSPQPKPACRPETPPGVLRPTELSDPNTRDGWYPASNSAILDWSRRSKRTSVRDGRGRSWEDAREFGFVSGGGGPFYSGTLAMLSPGDRIWVNITGQGLRRCRNGHRRTPDHERVRSPDTGRPPTGAGGGIRRREV